MEKLINFIDIIAWIACSLSFILVCSRVYGYATYSKLEEAMNSIHGIKVTFPITIPGVILIISSAWLLS